MTETDLDAFVAQYLAASRRAEAAAVRRGETRRELGRRQAAHAGVWGSDPPAPRAPAEAAPAKAAGLDPSDPIERRIAERLARLQGLVDGLTPGPDADGVHHHKVVAVDLSTRHQAQVVAAAAAADLGLGALTVAFFAPARKVEADAFLSTDTPVTGLVRPVSRPGVVFIQASLDADEMAAAICHEARHLWQVQTGRATGTAADNCRGDLESDAVAYEQAALGDDGLAATALLAEERRLDALRTQGGAAAAAEVRRLAQQYGEAA